MRTSRALILFSLLIIGTIITSWMLGTILTAPYQRNFKAPTNNLAIEDIIFSGKTGTLLSGWFIKGSADHAGILLMHSIRSDRREMLGRARFLNRLGYSVFLFDFQAHGKSGGDKITFGYRESKDAEAAFELLQSKVPNQPIGAIGVSLGVQQFY